MTAVLYLVTFVDGSIMGVPMTYPHTSRHWDSIDEFGEALAEQVRSTHGDLADYIDDWEPV